MRSVRSCSTSGTLARRSDVWDVVAAQLAVMRAQIGGLQAQVDVMQAIVDGQVASAVPETACRHENTEDDGSTLAQRRVRCLECGAVLIGDTMSS